VLDPFNG